MTKIYLIRHAEPISVTECDQYSSKETDQITNEKMVLSVCGEQQAKLLSTLPVLDHIDAVLCSHYARAMGTAKYIANHNHISFQVDSRFGERVIGTTKEFTENADFWMDQYLNPTYKCRDGESQIEVQKRMWEAIQERLVINPGKRLAVVSHGTAISFLLMKWCHLLEIDRTKRRHFTFHDKSVINDRLHTPEIFALTFDCKQQLIDVELIRHETMNS
jgi:broad specificity phosphatase PhoE